MIAALLLCLGATVDFWSQDIAPLRAGVARPLSGDPTVNYHRADLDGDGHGDLVFTNGVALQRDRGFPAEAFVPFPGMTPDAEVDTLGPHLYVRDAAGLHVLRVRDHAWDTVAQYAIEWPPAEGLDPTRWQQPESGNSAKLHPFLHDVEDDGVPEVFVLSARGVHVYRLADGAYTCAAPYAVLPALRLATGNPQPVWPATARKLAFPVREMASRVNFDGPAVTILTQESLDDGRVQFTRTRYPNILREAPGSAPGAGERIASAPLPAHLRPCRLNGEAGTAYAGLRWDVSPPAPMPIPLLELWVTLDAGQQVRRERMRLPQGYQPAALFTDYDHDGALDLVVEESGLFEGGPREAALRLHTQASVSHTVRIYPQHNGAFSDTPILSHTLRIALTAPPGREPAALRRYQAGGLVNLSGDFNGDRRNDLAVRDEPGRIAIYLARDNAYGKAPDAIIPLAFDVPFVVDDLNDDGRSDLITLSADGDTAETIARVHFAGSAP
jgi:hypothetical protein